MLDGCASEIILLTERAVVVDQYLRDQEKRDAFRPRWRVRQAGQHHMDDVLRHVVFAIGNVDFLTLDSVVAVLAFRSAPQLRKIAACMRFGEVHRAGPFTGNQLRKIGLLQFR